MRRTVVALMAAGAALAGCGASPAPKADPRVLNEIVYVNPLPESKLWDRFGACMKAEAAKHDIALRSVGPPGGDVDAQAMQNLVSQAVSAKAPAIVTWTIVGSAGFDPLFAKHRAHGGVVATFLSWGATKNQNFNVDEHPKKAMESIVAAVAELPGQRRLGIIEQTPDGAREAAYQKGLAAGLAKHPNVELVDTRYDYGRFSERMAMTSAMLTEHPDINTLWTYGGHPGALAAIEERGLAGKVVAFTSPGDAPDVAIAYSKKGIVAGLKVRDHCAMGRLMVTNLRRAWSGRPVPKYVTVPARVVGPAEFERMVTAGQFP